MDAILVWVSVAAFASFVFIALEEMPWSFNVARVARRVRRVARRHDIDTDRAIERIARQTRLGALVLAGFGLLSIVFTVIEIAIHGLRPDFALLAAALIAGMAVLTAAFWFLAPRLFEVVRQRLDAESATPNSFAAHPEPPHGPRP